MANYDDAYKYSVYPKGMVDPRYDINISDKPKDTIPATLVVDSSKRDYSLFPDPGRYVFTLTKPYRDVTSVELVQANIPDSSYTINGRNNLITVTSNLNDTGSTTATATIPNGNYTGDTLATAYATALNAATERTGLSSNQMFRVSFSSTTQLLTVIGPTKQQVVNTDLVDNAFTLVVGGINNADYPLGLGGTSLVVAIAVAPSVALPHSVVLRPDKFAIMNIQGMERCDGNSNALMNCFCIIPIDSASEVIDNDTYIYHFPEPLPKLNKMDITFTAMDGTTFDFNGREHFLIFEIKSLNRPNKIG